MAELAAVELVVAVAVGDKDCLKAYFFVTYR